MSNPSRNVTLWTRPAFDVDRWVQNFFGPDRDVVASGVFGHGFTPAAEVVKDGDDAVVRLELAGIDVTKDVTVELDQGRLVIRGERRDEHSSDDPAKDGRTLREVRYGAFRRSFRLPAHVHSDAISASYDAGVLTVRVSGVYQSADAQRIAIDSK